MTDVNIPLLREAEAWVHQEAAKPKELRHWVQKDYVSETACGTAYCVAGYVGQRLHPDFKDTSFSNTLGYVSDFAADMLGIATDEAMDLFSERNSAEDISRIINNIITNAENE